jgi:pilus assembly protein CpaF
MQDLFKFQIDEITGDGTIVGGLRPTGLRPGFINKFEKRGIPLPLSLFQPYGEGPAGDGSLNPALGVVRS